MRQLQLSPDRVRLRIKAWYRYRIGDLTFVVTAKSGSSLSLIYEARLIGRDGQAVESESLFLDLAEGFPHDEIHADAVGACVERYLKSQAIRRN